MDTENTTRVVKNWYDNLAKGNVAAIIEGMAEDVVFEIPKTKYNEIIPWAGVWRGREQVGEAFSLRDEGITLKEFEPRDFIVENDRAVVFVYERSVCKETGIEFELDIVQVVTVKNDQIATWKAYYDPCSILEAFHSDTMSIQLLNSIENKELSKVEICLNQNADPNFRNRETGLTALMMAACQGNPDIVKMLLDAGADVLTTDSRTGASVLHKACQGGNLEVVRLLIEAGAFIDAVTPTMGHTPIMDALWYKWPEIVKILVEHNADLNLSTHYGFSMMEHFQFELNVNTLGKDQLLEIDTIFKSRIAQNNVAIETQKIIAATNKGDLETIKKLIEQGEDVNTVHPIINSFLDGHTPLLVACRDGHTTIVRELLDAGADVNVVDWVFKGSPIHKATYNGNPEILKMLVTHPNIDINVQGPINGYTPLHDALWHGYTECAEILLEAGAKLGLNGHDGKTPLDVALDVYGADDEIVEYIRSRMTDK